MSLLGELALQADESVIATTIHSYTSVSSMALTDITTRRSG